MVKSKYPHVHDVELMAVESLVLFDNANRDVQPDLLIDLPWGQVRQFFVDLARDPGEIWLGTSRNEVTVPWRISLSKHAADVEIEVTRAGEGTVKKRTHPKEPSHLAVGVPRLSSRVG